MKTESLNISQSQSLAPSEPGESWHSHDTGIGINYSSGTHPTGSLLRTPERWWTTQRDEHNRRWGTQTAHSPLTTGDWLTYKHRVWITVWLSSMSRLSNCLFQKQYATKSTGNTFIYNVQAGFPAKSSTTCSGCFWVQSCFPDNEKGNIADTKWVNYKSVLLLNTECFSPFP